MGEQIDLIRFIWVFQEDNLTHISYTVPLKYFDESCLLVELQRSCWRYFWKHLCWHGLDAESFRRGSHSGLSISVKRANVDFLVTITTNTKSLSSSTADAVSSFEAVLVNHHEGFLWRLWNWTGEERGIYGINSSHVCFRRFCHFSVKILAAR